MIEKWFIDIFGPDLAFVIGTVLLFIGMPLLLVTIMHKLNESMKKDWKGGDKK